MQTSYPKEKLNKIKVVAAKAILPSTTPAEIDNDSEIIEQLVWAVERKISFKYRQKPKSINPYSSS